MIRIILAYEIWKYELAITKKEFDFESSEVKVTSYVTVHDEDEKKPRCY